MSSLEYEKEFDLTPEQAYKTIGNWLVGINAKIEDHKEPVYILAVHGTFWTNVENTQKKKKISITIKPLNTNKVQIHLKTTLTLWYRNARMENARKSWEEGLINQLWATINEKTEDGILWQIKVTQYLIALPIVTKESDFKRFMKKLCQSIDKEQLTEHQVLQMTEALKLTHLSCKIFAPTKKEKVFKIVTEISNKILGEGLSVAISGALHQLVEFMIK